MLTESLGYVASGLIIVSLTMSSVLHLRMVNLIGSITFGVYAVMIGAVPILLTNIILVVVNLHHIRRLRLTPAPASYPPLEPACHLAVNSPSL